MQSNYTVPSTLRGWTPCCLYSWGFPFSELISWILYFFSTKVRHAILVKFENMHTESPKNKWNTHVSLYFTIIFVYMYVFVWVCAHACMHLCRQHQESSSIAPLYVQRQHHRLRMMMFRESSSTWEQSGSRHQPVYIPTSVGIRHMPLCPDWTLCRASELSPNAYTAALLHELSPQPPHFLTLELGGVLAQWQNICLACPRPQVSFSSMEEK